MHWFTCLLVLFSVADVLAQQPVPVAEAAYQGETVTSIHLVANPHVDVEPFRALVVQKPGQPYSQDKVQASIAALEKTGKFGAVTTSITPEPQGLRLTFVLHPAYYVGIIEFPEAARHFSYIRLLQIVNFPSEDPFDKSLIPDAESALRKFFHENGYFQALVHTETQFDDINQLANLTFRVNLGRRARIGAVHMEGTNQAETARLMHSVRSLWARLSGGLLKPGKTYTAERIKEATKLITKSLSGQQYLAAKVQEQPPRYHPDTNRVDVVFNVDTGPVIIIRTTGASLTWVPFMAARERKKLIPIYS
jgi:outer membrane protein insertion porin family